MRRRWTLEQFESRLVPTYYGNQVFPVDNPWNQDISGAPVAGNSAAIISTIVSRHGGTAPRVHPDWGNPAVDLDLYGIPVNVATSATPKYTITIPAAGYASESDRVQVPIPANAVLEGDDHNGPAPPSTRGDSHLIVYDKDNNDLYELVSAARPTETVYPFGGTKPAGVWGAYQVSFWDLDTNHFRTIGATSADAAGLPVMPGLVRPDEANPPAEGGVGVIDHAIRVTVVRTRGDFVFPASHEASNYTESSYPRMGERFRLKSSFVIPSTWSPEAKAIAQAMKTYGLIVADHGSDFYFQGTPSSQWDMAEVKDIQGLRATDFEVVDLTPRVTGLSVTTGSTAGGTAVAITGQNFGGSAGELHVLFGNVEAASVTVLSDTQLLAVAPAHAAGTVDVRVRSGSMHESTSGTDVFFGYGTSAVVQAARFTFDAGAVNPSAPTAGDDSYTVLHDRTLTVTGTGLLANDVSNPAGRTLTAALAVGPSHGTLTLNTNGSFTYRPAAGYHGTDSFTYTAIDGGVASAVATVNLTVTDQAPTAAGDAYKTGKGRALTVTTGGLLANDTDADGDLLTAALATQPANGTVTPNANGSFTYTPNATFAGTDTFTYVANDKARDSAPATVSIAVAAPPRVKSVVINDGSAQRSRVTSITVTFDTLVTLDPGAFRMVRSNGTLAGMAKKLTAVNGETQVVLTFTGAGTYGRSLVDGSWTLRIVKSRVHRADYRAQVMEADTLTSFHRLYGDWNGDRTVDTTDQGAFDAAYGQVDVTALATFDVNRDGRINEFDRGAFNRRLGRTV